ncbi:MAG: diiron oxygenase [Actinomycetota bacterium]|nr:diiron oxygenase [Actinomycetota bacterium]
MAQTVETKATTIDDRIERLSSASLKHVIEPDVEVPGEVRQGQVIPDELLSISGLDLDLTPEQRATLSREEVASITDAGVRFEAVLAAGFSALIMEQRDLTDPKITYILHEMGEETRHSRLFIRLISQLQPKARNPLRPLLRTLRRMGLPTLLNKPALFCVLVLTGEEVPDLLQKRAVEHPGTDPFIRDLNRYHRAEEARHLQFGRMILPELWERAGLFERFMIRRWAPWMMRGTVETLVHPGVYEVVGLPKWRTWWAANRTPRRVAFRHEALRPVLKAVIDAGVLRRGRIPRRWRKVCGVDKHGNPVS